MKTSLFALIAALVLAGLLITACAPERGSTAPAGNVAVSDAGLEAVRDAVTGALPDVKRDNVQPSAIPGLYELSQDGQYGYITGDGRHLIDGDLIDLVTRVNLTENKRKDVRVTELAALGEENMIVFAPEKTEYAVTVFTDIDCGYCRKLHREIEDYNARGIAIRYAFYPRAGPNSPSFRKAESVWCADDRKQALTLAKQGGDIQNEAGCENPVAREYMLGAQLGLRGTPMMILPDGEVVNGYMPADALAERLQMKEQG
ncbi:DsbC family protein [Sinimarinibacterium flocculans]|uniref:Thiol:disulfide interchange protein n=1 Tax=Sinimarinibacterium flocculans TaxID=985250 RepID=A0A318E7Y1_9GAMM|nr:DsbC family protein [Sinimarinibacterium flocculans]PXV67807.1 thiol:disulfide interchange protein DsbC [Sinimarinibacterium flocculans]